MRERFFKGEPPSDLTPAMKQYLELKALYPDCILFFRMGDFYEMFFEDALLASQLLEIALTTREKGKENPIPMCGVPWKAASSYIAKLLEKGYKVAICEQVEDAKEAKGLIRREVVQVITPGMVLDEEGLPQGRPNYLLSLYPGRKLGLSFFDLSTGEFRGTSLEEKGLLWSELRRNAPREILLPEGEEELKGLIKRELDNVLITMLPEREFLPLDNPLIPEGLQEELLASASAVLRYVSSTQGQVPPHIKPFEIYQADAFLVLDETTQKNLELFQSPAGGTPLFAIIDHTLTSMGKRKLRKWLSYPLKDISSITERQEAIEELTSRPLERLKLQEALKGLMDLERLSSRLALNRATPRDLGTLRDALKRLPKLRKNLSSFTSPLLQEIREGVRFSPEVLDLLERALVDDPPQSSTEGGIIREGYHEELDELRRLSREGKEWIARLESKERERTGIPNLRIGYNQVFGYYIEVTRSYLHLVPKDYVRKQTLVGAERFITPELKEYEAKVLGAEERIKGLEYELFCEIRSIVSEKIREIQRIGDFIATLDCLLSLSEVASINHYVRPKVDDSDEIIIREGRHPVIEKTSLEPFVPNDTRITPQERLLIITGPNMAGKSTYIRQVALMVILAQMGAFVPAKEAKIGLVDRIFSRIGAMDDISRGQSTFMVEMRETASILKEATQKSLVILDEIGRGTSTYDGLAIAWAVAEHLHNVNRSRVLFATHYHELIELGNKLPCARNYHVTVKEYHGDIVFLREVRPGGMSKSYGIQVARLAGLPVEVIERAKEILQRLERDSKSRNGFSKEALQLFLFSSPKFSPILKEIEQIDPDQLTPLKALELIYRWKGMTSSKDHV